ncbi:MAG: efflux RND transporter periplasmic adaptor subunit [Pseudomonadota bacterium]
MQAAGRAIARVAVLPFVLMTIASCGGGETETEREPAVRPVKLITLTSASAVETGRYPAVVDAAQRSELSFQIGGLIEELAVTESEDVERGAVIARLDPRDFRSQVDSARSQFNNAEEEYQRAVRLAAEDAIARSVLEQREAQRDVAKAQLDSAEKALEDAVLRAPFAGVVAQVPVRERETVAAGQLIASLIGIGALEVTVNLPANLVARSQEVEDRSAFVILDAAPDSPITAEFKEADLLADTASQTYRVTFEFEPPENLLILPGMNATVELNATRLSARGTTNRISVPLSAVLSDGAQSYVWIVDEDSMTVTRQPVTVADGIGETVVVTAGLTTGDTIATAGASFLADGMQVRPWTQ